MAFIVTFGRPPKFVIEQIVRLKLREGAGPLTSAIAANPGHCDSRIVIEHRQGHAAEESKCRIVTVTKRFGRLRRIGFDEDCVRVRQHHNEVMQLAFKTTDHARRLAKINLRMPRGVAQWHENLFRPPLLLPNIIRDNGDPAREAMFITQPLMDTLRRVTLLLDPTHIVREDPVDDRDERIKPGANRWPFTPVTRRNRVLQNLRNGLAINSEQTRRRAVTHPVNMARTPYPAIKFH